MSSLAGALIAPDKSPIHAPVKIGADEEFVSDSGQDIEMQPPETELELRDEDDVKEDMIPHQDGKDEEMEDLFGNDNDLDEVKREGPQSSVASALGSEKLSTPEAEQRRALEYAEEDEPGAIVEEVREAHIAFPNIPLPRTLDGDHWVIRMPNYVKVDSKPYHPDTYMGPEHEDEEAQQAETLREKSMTIKLKVENTVRWRWIKDEFGHDRRQSNSRIIRWSDGTLSLRLGKELFDINKSIDTSGGVPRQAFGPSASQGSQTSSQPVGGKSQGLTYLVAQHKRAELLQSEALVTGYMSLRPTGMQSETHRMLVRAVGQKHNKVARLRMAPDPTIDPEREKLELIKLAAKKSKKKAEEDGFGGRKRRGYQSRRKTGQDMWSDDDDEADFAASEDEDGDGNGNGVSKKVKRKAAEDDSAKRRGGDYQEDDFVVADSSDEEGPESGGKKKRQRGDGEDDIEQDPLDRLEDRIRKQEEEEKKRRRRESSGEKAGHEQVGDEQDDDGKEEEMDVESEEDEEEEEHRVRRAGGSGKRKKRAVGFDDDDEEEE